MKKILVPFDFSDFSKYALKAACDLSKKYDYKVSLIHMLEIPQGYSDFTGESFNLNTMHLIKLSETKLENLLSEDDFKDFSIEVILKHYLIFNTLGEFAEEKGFDLIVMGSHGVTGVAENLIGSNTDKVIRGSKVPVLTVKKPLDISTLDSVVYASDFKESSIPNFIKVKQLFKEIGIPVKYLYVNLPNTGFISNKDYNFHISRFIELLPDEQKISKDEVTLYNDYSVEAGTLHFIKENNIPLIAMATHGRTGINKFIYGSISEDISHHTDTPIISFKMD